MSAGIGIVGSGGHARSVINLLEHCGRTVAGIYDDSFTGREEMIDGYPLRGALSALPPDLPLVLAIGDNRKREEMFERFSGVIVREPLVHAAAIVSERVRMGDGNLVFARAVINDAVRIGSNNIINSGAIVEHDCVIANHAHISVGSILAGRVSVGNRCFVGAGAVVIDGCSIFDDVVIGAGAVVIDDITESGTYVGVPARKVR